MYVKRTYTPVPNRARTAADIRYITRARYTLGSIGRRHSFLDGRQISFVGDHRSNQQAARPR